MPEITQLMDTGKTNEFFNSTFRKLAEIMVSNISQKNSDKTLNLVISSIISARGIFCIGGGNSGNIIRILAMRLMHMGFRVHVHGDTTTPATEKGDLVIVASGSADYNFKKIKRTGGRILLFTSNTKVEGLDTDDIIVEIKGRRLKGKNIGANDLKDIEKIAPMGTIYESSLFLYILALIAILMKVTGITEQEMEKRHANIKY